MESMSKVLSKVLSSFLYKFVVYDCCLTGLGRAWKLVWRGMARAWIFFFIVKWMKNRGKKRRKSLLESHDNFHVKMK